MADRVSDLLEQLASEEAPRRDEVSERARRRRMAAAMRTRLESLPQPQRPPQRLPLVLWAVLPAAAAAVLLATALPRLWHTERVLVQAEQWAGNARPSQPTSGPSQAAQAPPPLPPAVASQRPASKRSAQPKPSAAPSALPAREASLAAQNELFQAAVRASRRGDDASALEQLDTLLQRYPGSVLAADALVRKFRTLSRLGRDAEARAAAAEYLRRHPEGFAAKEARSIAAEESANGSE